MEIIVLLLVPLPLGLLVRHRTAGFVAYTAVHAFVFTFQSLVLVVGWAGGVGRSAFGAFPAADMGEVWAYGAVNLVVYAVGLGLLVAGQRVAGRRRAEQSAVDVTPVG
ncbi:hypothetical protein [Klenkia taihuensis]|uniref:Uncharacterized protein n=1 Tax=Klenkia taihuensis TaxID=1225127 RepID=A0A1I1NLX0_9ACTN|nr:hypothetical protein [Klenkia taihuensis]SFC98426.1 hypothetical protein SAMN05661030_2175 [Klenkia taihuensis]